MVVIQEALSKKQQREFLNFPLKLYQDDPNFVPPLYMDEKKIFQEDYVYYDTCEAVYYNAYRDGKMVGRISGILQKASNEKNQEKRIRFTRFDAIDDPEVAKALFDAVENWGREKGMDTICGPLGFSDLEREGLLIDGFSELATFEEQYNAPYYQKLIEDLGYEKEVDWFESKIRPPKTEDEKLKKTAEFIMNRYHLHWAECRNTKDFLRRYSDKCFDLLDRSYEKIYGTVPFTDNMKKLMIDNFKLIIKEKYIAAIVDENDRLICFGVCFPSLAKALQKSGGRLTPAALPRVLKAIRHPEIIDFGLIGVDPEYLNRGVSACITVGLIDMLKRDHIEHAETNLNLEHNYAIRNLWKRFDAEEHKKRRSYIKRLV